MDVSCKVSLQMLSRNSLKVLLFSNCTKRWINISIKQSYCYGDRGAVVPGEVFMWLMLLIIESRNRGKASVIGYMLLKHFDLLPSHFYVQGFLHSGKIFLQSIKWIISVSSSQSCFFRLGTSHMLLLHVTRDWLTATAATSPCWLIDMLRSHQNTWD